VFGFYSDNFFVWFVYMWKVNTNTIFKLSDLRAAHIYKNSTNGLGLEAFKLHPSDVHNARNGLLLIPQIEEEFDRKHVCFLYDPFKVIVLVVVATAVVVCD
jgi:hypothetical protein